MTSDGPTHRGALPLVGTRWAVSTSGTGGSSAFSGDVTVPSDVLDLSVSSGNAGMAIARARTSGLTTAAENPWPRQEGDVMARVDFTAGNTDADGAALVGIGGFLSSSAWVALRCGADGQCRVIDSSGADITTDVAGPDSTERTAGNLWLRFTRTITGVVAAWGVAVDSDHYPETWFTVAVVCDDLSALANSQGGTPILGAIATGSGVAGGLTARFSGVGLFGASARVCRGRGSAPAGSEWTAEDS